jgi:Arc/MetJ family transcription regulator
MGEPFRLKFVAALLDGAANQRKPKQGDRRRSLHSITSMCILSEFLHIEAAMRTNIDIDDLLMKRAMQVTGYPTKKATVEAALAKVIAIAEQTAALDAIWGTGWEGDLDEMRDDWTSDKGWGFHENS